MEPEPQNRPEPPRVVRIVQLADPSERIIGPFPPETSSQSGAHEWITEHLTQDWTMIQDMPLEVPESDCCPLCGTRKLPQSLGMGHGPADPSEREGFDDE